MSPGLVIVTGASSQIGLFLLPQLLKEGVRVAAVSRNASFGRMLPQEVQWHNIDLKTNLQGMPAGDCLIHLAPIWILPGFISLLGERGLTRLVAFSSTSAISKRDSVDPQERELASRLKAAEDEVIAQCDRCGIKWTLFRPTLIYGTGRDANVTAIARFIHRYGFFPLAGQAHGLRQPVHAEDLAQAVMAVVFQPVSYSKIYTLSGGEVLSYQSMVRKIFAALHKTPRLISLPTSMVRLAITIAAYFPRYKYLTPAMADRMNQDLAFSHEQARLDFNFHPRPFEFENPFKETGGL